MPNVSPLDGKICPKCGEPFAWLERRLRGDRVTSARSTSARRTACGGAGAATWGLREEVGQKPEEVRASPRLEAEEVQGEEEPRAAGREIPMRKGGDRAHGPDRCRGAQVV